ncbi:hypothetical protein [Ralstonia chuxiongensis]|uniref:Uncharacterized protein n=1 Tax=Ralstonia chuxiongensis TaxID=2957504 RepID=A0AA41WM98_9RALS|nr:hypothetical protein [Ralstonia chuxiongensis]MCP1170811.1 hypothetical protein [Ralstonia chuxiongensis]
MLRYALLAYVFATAFPALADGPLTIPRSEQATDGYLSTALLLKPCLDIHEWSPEPNDDLLKQVADARKGLPPETGDSPALVEKLFKARFLQYASIAVVSDPWNLDAKIRAQSDAMGRCKNTGCLDRELDAAIAALSAVYLNSHPEWPNGTGLCVSKAVDVAAAKVRALLGAKVQKDIVDTCAPESLSVQTCRGLQGTLVFAGCTMSGNQVNAPEWLFRIRGAKLESLLAIDDGPSGMLKTTCNGMPDLMTAARVSMGEHYVTYYRYDGTQYQSVYGYTAMGIGTDDNGNDLTIAQGGLVTPVVCR